MHSSTRLKYETMPRAVSHPRDILILLRYVTINVEMSEILKLSCVFDWGGNVRNDVFPECNILNKSTRNEPHSPD